jgi:tetratricopeptide (TPR) repeat protein
VNAVNRVIKILLAVVFVSAALAQSPESPLSDPRYTVHTLVREDIFAGFLSNDMERFARGEKNVDLLLEKRPAAKSDLLAWKASTTMYRAILAHENNRPDEFKKLYQTSRDLFAEATKLNPDNGGVSAIRGGTYAVFADRLPKELRTSSWSEAYDSYQVLYKQQASIIDRLPVHLRGELLAGLAQSAQRTGRAAEAAQYVDKILEVLPNTPYEPVARQWKKNPQAAADSTITCLTCHDAGRLAARSAALNK